MDTYSLCCIFTVASTAAAEAQASTFARLSPQSRSRRSAQRACPEKVFLPGVASLKGADCLPASVFFKGFRSYFQRWIFVLWRYEAVRLVPSGCQATSGNNLKTICLVDLDLLVVACNFSSNCIFPDLERLFLQAGIGLNSLGLTQRDLRTVFGTLTPSTEAMACFDTDRDRRFSLMELRAAVGV